VWQLPELAHSNRWMREAAGGWELTGITSAQTGAPITLLAGTDRSQTGIGEDHAQYLGGSVYTSGPCASSPCVQYLVPSAFGLPALGTYGDMAKGTLRGPGFFNTDIGAIKNFSFSERVKLQFRAEFFDILNRPNFGNPNTSVTGAGFGDILTAKSNRIGQLALKVVF
jgi:hypothetical protein